MIVFKYKTEELGIIRPGADVILEFNHNRSYSFLYIDSGADISLIPYSTGDLLGLKLDKEKDEIEQMKGVSGYTVPFVKRDIIIHLDKNTGFQIPIAWSLIEEVPPLLGRQGIFNKFRITFDEINQEIRFVRNKQKNRT